MQSVVVLGLTLLWNESTALTLYAIKTTCKKPSNGDVRFSRVFLWLVCSNVAITNS